MQFRVTRLVLLCAAMLALLISCSVTFGDGVKYTCTKDEDCGGDGYTCARSPSRSVCCKATGAEVCDKLDNDCDGFDLKTNSNHCGACGNVCPGTQFCKNSLCTIRPENVCFDNFDDDGNGLIDCEDPSCENRSCGQSCLCTGLKRAEDRCDDNIDNDVGPDGGGDGFVDCADSDCTGKSCRGGCTCVADGGQLESDCTDGLDNDLDTRIDCLDADCVNQFCTPPDIYFRCTAVQTCRCNGGVQVSEVGSVLCRDGVDNDCDGEIDCTEASCLGQSCTPDGGVGCECAGPGKKEVGCSNNLDDDGDSKVDCADTDCQGITCRLPDAGDGMCSSTQCN